MGRASGRFVFKWRTRRKDQSSFSWSCRPARGGGWPRRRRAARRADLRAASWRPAQTAKAIDTVAGNGHAAFAESCRRATGWVTKRGTRVHLDPARKQVLSTAPSRRRWDVRFVRCAQCAKICAGYYEQGGARNAKYRARVLSNVSTRRQVLPAPPSLCHMRGAQSTPTEPLRYMFVWKGVRALGPTRQVHFPPNKAVSQDACPWCMRTLQHILTRPLVRRFVGTLRLLLWGTRWTIPITCRSLRL